MKKLLAAVLAGIMMLSIAVVSTSAAGDPVAAPLAIGYQDVTPTITDSSEGVKVLSAVSDFETTQKVYTINSVAGMDALASLCNSGTYSTSNQALSGYTFYLTADIKGTAQAYADFIIGAQYANSFAAIFDGQGYTIDYWKSTEITSAVAGMFVCVNGGTIKNLQIGKNCILNPQGGNANSGCGLIGYAVNGAIISNINSAMNILEETTDYLLYRCGGLVGNVQGSGVTISNCTVSGSITDETNNSQFVGGILGQLDNTAGTTYITNCVFSGSISGAVDFGAIVGIVGRTSGVSRNYEMALCTNYSATAAVIGKNNSTTRPTVEQCYSDATPTWLLGHQQSAVYDQSGTQVVDIRVIGVLDSLDFDEVGFEITFKDTEGTEISSNKIDRNCQYVYERLTGVAEDSTVIEYVAEDIRIDGYLFAIVIKGVPVDAVGTFDVKTFVVETDASDKTYGESGTLTLKKN